MSRHMTPQKYRSGKQLGLWVSTETAGRLATLAKRAGIPQSELLRRGLELLFEEYADGPREPKRAKGRKQ